MDWSATMPRKMDKVLQGLMMHIENFTQHPEV